MLLRGDFMNLKTQEIYSRIETLCKKNGITCTKLCEKTDINVQTYRGWVYKGVMLDATSVVKIAKALNSTAEYIITGEKMDQDIDEVIAKLQTLTPEKRSPIIALINQQVDYWSKQ